MSIESTISTRHTASVHHSGRFRRSVGIACATVALALTTFGLGASTAGAANAGTVMCVNGAKVVGVWVQVNGGRSGWATRSGAGYSQRWSYNTQGKSYRLDVGCGGTPSKWQYRTTTGSFKKWTNVTCFPGRSYGGASIYGANYCIAA